VEAVVGVRLRQAACCAVELGVVTGGAGGEVVRSVCAGLPPSEHRLSAIEIVHCDETKNEIHSISSNDERLGGD
jgi:hypothetical protein